MTALEISDLEVTYPGDPPVQAVRGLSLRVRSGEVVGLAGESGCGKSTVAHAVLRLLPAQVRVSGQVRLDGENLLAMHWGRLRAVRWAGASIVFQGVRRSLNPVHGYAPSWPNPCACTTASGGGRRRPERRTCWTGSGSAPSWATGSRTNSPAASSNES